MCEFLNACVRKTLLALGRPDNNLGLLRFVLRMYGRQAGKEARGLWWPNLT
jgi:hypothetical protein